MEKRTRSLLEELEHIGSNRNIPELVESRASNVITSAINLIEYIGKHYDSDKAELLEKKLLSSIRGRDVSRFSKTMKKVK